MRIQHNIAAINAHRQLGGNNDAVAKNLEKLSSGYRINKAGDDAAGLSISEKMRAQIKGLETAQKNAQDGVSLIQTAEGNLTEVHSMLNRMVELATQAANGTYQDLNRDELQKEVTSLTSEIDRIASSANFNGIKLLDGSLKASDGAKGISSTVTAAVGATYTSTAAKMTGGATTDVKADITLEYTDAAGKAQTLKLDKADITVGGTGKDDLAKAIASAINNSTADGAKAFQKLFTAKASTTAGDIIFEAADGGAQKMNGITVATFKADASSGTGKVEKADISTASSANVNNKLTLDFTNFTPKAGITLEVNGNKFYLYDSTKTDDDDKAKGLNAPKDGYTSYDISQAASDTGAELSALFAGVIGSNAADAAGKLTITSTSFAKPPEIKIDGKTITGPTDGSGSTIGGLTLQVGETSDDYQKVTVSVGNMDAASLGLGTIDISNQDGAQVAMDAINAAIDQVSSTRGDLGALQNRLDHTINNLGVTTENMTAAESRIRDVDMAKEMMDFTKNNILTQAANAMLAQANTIPQGVLQLLG